jgi:hypothetical protein
MVDLVDLVVVQRT